MRLSECLSGKCQNLHLVRFLAAISVMFGHSFLLSTGNSNSEWMIRITKGRLSFGTLAVSTFFFFGGILIAKSMERLKTAKAYFKARVLRIFPSLILVNVCVVLLGVFFSSYSPEQYFTMAGTWKYLLNSIFIYVHNLPGVFTDNPYLPTVNGSLWTLLPEFLCYIACFVIYKIKCMDRKRFWITVPLAAAVFMMIYAVGDRMPVLRAMIRPCLLFYIGIAYWVFRDKIILEGKWALAAAVGFVCLLRLNFADLGLVLFFPYIMSTICFALKQVPAYIGRLGNYSYGIYLWGFPVQQAVVSGTGGKMSPYVNIMAAVPVAVILGIFTYIVAEKNI